MEDNVLRNCLHPLSLPACCLLLTLASCGNNFGFPGVYKINVEQGNVVTEEMVEQLRPGLNRRQVRYIMGTPLIEDSFHSDRWDYRYLLRNGNQTIAETQLTLWFEDDELVRAEGPDAPDWGQSQSESDEDADASED
ncbi:MAG: outer membrane protein assembly factor BamE [Halieaceae bacterium]